MPIIINAPSIIEGIDTSDATATTSDILVSKTAYANGEKITGIIPELNTQSYTPSTATQLISKEQYIKGDQIILGDTNLIPGNIKAGISIFGVDGTYKGGTAGTDIEVMRCSSMTTTSEVLTGYGNLVQVSNDGAYSTFTDLPEYKPYSQYNAIGATYTNSLAGINIRSANANTGFYYITPIKIDSSHILYELLYYMSTWINPSIVIHLISADSVTDIHNKIITGDYAYSKTVVLGNANNKNNVFFEVTDAPVGSYYLFIQMPTKVEGNEAVISNINIISL